MMHVLGGNVCKADVSEYGKTEVLVDKTSNYLKMYQKNNCWMSHNDYIEQAAPDLRFLHIQQTVR